MKIEQFYTGCLAQGAYYIESEGEAIVIDPLRDVSAYIDLAKERNAKITYVFETHFHADFVSGHLDLARKTGAKIVFGPGASTSYDAYIAKDNESFSFGKLTIRTLHTPGHTLESTTWLLLDENGLERAIFTGDTLFLGDVGRPDLAIKGDLNKEQLASYLFDSLRNKIMPLPDNVIVYPGHGAGSSCGKNMMKETVDTLGNQKKVNYALNPSLSREDFITEVLDGLTDPPAYFPVNAKMNQQGYHDIDDIVKRGLRALSVEEFEQHSLNQNTIILDTRNPDDFAKSFIPTSINIGIDGNFAPWVGTLISHHKNPILIITEPNREEEVVTRLARVGYENCIGYLEGGIKTWKHSNKKTEKIKAVDADKFVETYQQNNDIHIVDVRKQVEYAISHIKGALNVPLDTLHQQMESIPKNKPVYLHCAGGYRSAIAASLLKAKGYEDIINVQGGFTSISDSPIHLSCTI
ncbi:MAG: MBL fold metallo-hydrolase [Candidatus Competibacteraceae bacterium]|nr:MBL fold metallo-hydrolase [Candidatus Competibacteraceae bacterium]